MDTIAQKQQFYQSLHHTLEAYLQQFPDEKDRLRELTTHANNPDIDLRLRSTIPQGHLCASGILVLPNKKILMLKHKALGIWVVPGGHYDLTDQTLADTAIRETTEETSLRGVRLHPWHEASGIPLDIDTHPIPERKEKNEGPHQHFDFRYLLTLDNPDELLSQLTLDTNEVLDFKLFSPEEIDPNSSIAPALRKLTIAL
ncbi:MAG: NUDIX hydrolase [Candidatus Saccharimonadales bacterium]